MRLAASLALVLATMTGCIMDGSGDSPGARGGGKADGDEPDAGMVDIYADARDVTKAVVVFPAGTVAPTAYDYPNAPDFHMSGTEFWQKWTGGKNPTYSFTEGTDAGRLCMQASAIRFATIMADPPAELVKLDADTNWSGSFFNWNDDYSQSDWGDGTGARLWAWRTGLIKWISQTKRDGSCLLPTRDLVIAAATACLERGASAQGEIQGCSAQ